MTKLAIAAMFSAAVTMAAAATTGLSPQQVAQVEAGKGSATEQAYYVLACIQDAPCELALMQIWQTNGKAVPIENYLPTDDKIPPMFRGTDIARRMRSLGAVNGCNRDDACRAFLVEVTKSIRTLPPDEVRKIYAAKVELETQAIAGSGGQIQKNIQQAVANATVVPLATSPAVPGAAPAKPVESSSTSGEGNVIDFARDPFAKVTFQLVQLTNGSREIQKRSGDEVKRLAKVMGHDGKWLVELNDGTLLETSDIQLTSRGFIAGTSMAPVSYSETEGVVRVNWPAGFHTANIQRGDVAKTGYVLLEKDGADRNSSARMFELVASIGATLGATKKEDYVLLDLHRGKTYPLNISSTGKDVTTAYNCRAKNRLINVCKDADTRERLYDQGRKNIRHYAWIVYWFRAPSGTYLVALEDGARNVTVTKLETGEKKVAFSRSMGIADFSTKQFDDGHIAIEAQLAFSKKSIDNIEAVFVELPQPDVPTSSAADTENVMK